MRLLLFISFWIFSLHAQSVLVINSNAEIKKYAQAVEAFRKNYHHDVTVLDISHMSAKEIKNYLYDEYPDIVYAVGAKAYQYANTYLPEKTIYFSSIIDYNKLPMSAKRYGISNAVHNGMQLALITSALPSVHSIGIVYSKYTQNIMDDIYQNAQKIGIEIHPLKLTATFHESDKLDTLIQKSDALMIIPDPIFLNNQTHIKYFFNRAKQDHKAVIAYHELFINYGAVLAISVDNPTIGRQIAMMIENGNNAHQPVIQYPAGTHIIFNKREATQCGIVYNPDISQIATKIIE